MRFQYLSKYLQKEWCKNYGHAFVKNEYSDGVFKAVCDFYSEDHRHYHTLEHVAACLQLLNEYLDYTSNEHDGLTIINEEQLRIAIWFHDLIYNPLAKDNEDRSAQLAKTFLTGAHPIIVNFASGVYYLILATKHFNNLTNPDILSNIEKIMLDIDLSILGADEGHFEKYEADIREEYKLVSDDIYYPERLKIIVNFLNRPFLYHTKYFKDKLENQAQINLKNSLFELRKKLKYS